ncbi:MAG: hypothetical protein ACYC0F_08645 [Rhodanobacter sp.]
MLFQVTRLAADTSGIATALRMHDANATMTADHATGQIDVAAQLTSGQVIAILREAGCEASRLSEPRRVHVSGGSDCCGSCS